MDAPLPCPAGGGAEAVTPSLVTVSLGKRPMQPAHTCQGTGGYLSVRRPGCIFELNSDAVIPKARSRAARLCLGGSESRNRLSGDIHVAGFWFCASGGRAAGFGPPCPSHQVRLSEESCVTPF